jgi:hypothetical protein
MGRNHLFHCVLTACSVKENMTILCKKFFPDELAALQASLRQSEIVE